MQPSSTLIFFHHLCKVESNFACLNPSHKNNFLVTDFQAEVFVKFEGVTPDLFKEGSGVVVLGYFKDQKFSAEEIFAKHDENYMPPELEIGSQSE